MKKINQVL